MEDRIARLNSAMQWFAADTPRAEQLDTVLGFIERRPRGHGLKLPYLTPQPPNTKITLRCHFCGWYMKTTVGEREKVWLGHVERKHPEPRAPL